MHEIKHILSYLILCICTGENGVMSQTASAIIHIPAGSIRDGDVSTCVEIPTETDEAEYLSLRMAWPVHSGRGPNFNVLVIGKISSIQK